MATWFVDNWWWVLPIVLFPAVVWMVVATHKKTVRTAGGGWRSHIDTAAKTLLGIFALLLGYGAYAQGWHLGLLPIVGMIWLLNVPAQKGFALPNWTRYVGYSALLVVFVALFPVKS